MSNNGKSEDINFSVNFRYSKYHGESRMVVKRRFQEHVCHVKYRRRERLFVILY